jgi:hypothetical protein
MLKNLKKWFVVDDEEFKEKMSGDSAGDADIVPEQKAKPTSTSSSSSTSSTASSTVPSGKSSPKFTNILLQAMEANNLDGFDYLEYKHSLHNLAKMAMDEKTRYQSAYAAASTMGATPAKLVKTAHFYIDVLKKEEAKFAQALANQKDKQIGD